MTIVQTVEITEDRCLHLELPLAPLGKATVTVTVTPQPSRQYAAPPSGEWTNPLLGIAKNARLTLDRFMEMQREEIELENALDDRLWKRGR